MAVKLSLVLAVVVGVASALVAALLAVVCKCCWVWWRYRKTHLRRSASQESYFITQKKQWPGGGFTYQTYENGSLADYDSMSSGEEPYIVETPGEFYKLQFWVDLNKEDDLLIIGLVQAKGILCKSNFQTAYVYPVIQLYKEGISLDEREIEKQKMTFDPQWNEEVLFSLDGHPVETLSFCIRLIELDSFSNSHLIGQVEVSLEEVDSTEPSGKSQPKWYDIAGESKKPAHQYVGELLVSLNYFPTTQRLTIVILKARNLKVDSTSGLWGPTVKVILILNKTRLGKKRTAMQKKTLNPVYNEAFTFKVTSEALSKVTFKVLVVNKHSHGADKTVGHVLLGQQETGSGFSHWNHMLASLRKPVAMWHHIIPGA
ncbi:synaptotagmin-1-like [Stylophora pistillata]|uniref:Synaptotagmin-1 n=1 Tax=Stylophora pistillata TaxID=50429 RepID=A0A2B4SSM5_STYPI|nr:synaptotagmin-1-like [Stylophora pistillata]PFX31542.1 Synaptotagmin-1 [Stylophora pistillata]